MSNNTEDWQQLAATIEEINKVVRACPESVQEKCFELLFDLKILGHKIQPIPLQGVQTAEEIKDGVKSPVPPYKLPGNVLVILKKNNLSEKDLEKLFMLDHQPILPIFKIDSSKLAVAQVQQVFMILLENALTTGQFKALYSDIRDACKDAGFHDSNFTANLKKHFESFKGTITEKTIDENGTVELSPQGLSKLAEIIKQLAQ